MLGPHSHPKKAPAKAAPKGKTAAKKSKTPPKPAPNDPPMHHMAFAQKLHDVQAEAQERVLGDKTEFYDTSDSETEATRLDKGKKQGPAHDARRLDKAQHLTALVKTLYPMDAEQEELAERLLKLREKDSKERPNEKTKYTAETKKAFAEAGETMKGTSLLHNHYLRRASKTVLTPKVVKSGTSKLYNQVQGKIRANLTGVLEDDMGKMKWKASDFEDPKTWDGLQFLLQEGYSNHPKKPAYADVPPGGDASGASAKAAFHHLAWKESMKGMFRAFATSPANLSGLNDSRESKKGTSKVGSHEGIGHKGAGYLKSHQGVLPHAYKGGHFKAMDPEAALAMASSSAQPRTRKADIYTNIMKQNAPQKATAAPGPAPSPSPAPPPTAAKTKAPVPPKGPLTRLRKRKSEEEKGPKGGRKKVKLDGYDSDVE